MVSLKRVLCLLLLFTPGIFLGQINFEKGYFIDDTGSRTEAYIRNEGWKNNPTTFAYKLQPEGQTIEAGIEEVSEFAIGKNVQYVRARVPVEQSYLGSLSRLDTRAQLQQEIQTVYLRTLVKGKASLYHYESSRRAEFFYSKDGEIEPLLYKKYLTSSGNLQEYRQFQQQLFTGLQCGAFEFSDVAKLDYKTRDLVNFFVDYNQCVDSEFVNLTQRDNPPGAFHLSLRPGIRMGSMKYNNPLRSREIDFGNQVSVQVGLEAEYVLPFFRNKWAFIAEPTYQYYKGEAPYDKGMMDADYRSIEIPFGIRHYFFLSEEHRLFLNGTLTIDFSLGDSAFNIHPDSMNSRAEEITTNMFTNFSIGGGYRFQRFSAELRYNFDRKVSPYQNISTAYSSMALVVGYRFL